MGLCEKTQTLYNWRMINLEQAMAIRDLVRPEPNSVNHVGRSQWPVLS